MKRLLYIIPGLLLIVGFQNCSEVGFNTATDGAGVDKINANGGDIISPDDPGTPSDPGTPGDPGTTNNPGTPGDPGITKDPGSPNDPGNPGDVADGDDDDGGPNNTGDSPAEECGKDNKKVLICHIPPGNPAAKHTICIGAPALKAHKDHHGDSLGECSADNNEEGNL